MVSKTAFMLVVLMHLAFRLKLVWCSPHTTFETSDVVLLLRKSEVELVPLQTRKLLQTFDRSSKSVAHSMDMNLAPSDEIVISSNLSRPRGQKLQSSDPGPDPPPVIDRSDGPTG